MNNLQPSDPIGEILSSLCLEVQQYGATPEDFGTPPTIAEAHAAIERMMVEAQLDELNRLKLKNDHAQKFAEVRKYIKARKEELEDE